MTPGIDPQNPTIQPGSVRQQATYINANIQRPQEPARPVPQSRDPKAPSPQPNPWATMDAATATAPRVTTQTTTTRAPMPEVEVRDTQDEDHDNTSQIGQLLKRTVKAQPGTVR